MNDNVEDFYDRNVEREWNRLERHPMEFAVTMRSLEDFLPPVPANVVDIGGGPGRYSLELARLGYQVTLVDLSQGNLDLARKKAGEAGVNLTKVVHANALNLSVLPADEFDAVLLMGPLYHLIQEQDRREAILQAKRLLRPGGLFFATFITRFAALRDAMPKHYIDQVRAQDQVYQLLWENGINHADGGFTDTYFCHPGEVLPLMENCGLATVALVAQEGFSAAQEDRLEGLSPENWNYWVEWNYRLSKDPCLLGASDHLLYIGKKLA